MVKFGKPEATWKTGEEENSYGGEWGGVVASGRGSEKGEKRQREKFHERATDGRRNRREIRDKETDTDNEKTSTARKEAGSGGREHERKRTRG